MTVQRSSPRGVVASLVASAMFGAIFYIAAQLQSSAEVVYAWRVVVTLALYALALLHPGARRGVVIIWRRLRARWWMPLLALLLASIIGMQLWLFMWAPMHGHGLDAGLGYLLLPISLVLSGRFLMRAHVSSMQWVVVTLAVIAVAIKIVATPQLSWVTWAICLPYAVYFVLRQRFGLDEPMAFGFELTAMMPLAAWFLLSAGSGPQSAGELTGLLAVGVIGGIAMVLYLAASNLLSMPVFGLLSYAEPVLLVVVAVLLGERMQGADLLVYGILAVALALLAFEGFRAGRRRR
ncbi:EamA family transporter RarD [Microbacterium sp. NPDC089321]|uniref:EamA family transporter RarD n=1 Tax=Microbacterium sp. NPDC089321 TaxID=3155183 RepID=UPI00341802F6